MTSKDKYIASLGALFALTMFLAIPSDGHKSSAFGWILYFMAVIWLAYVALKNGLNMVNEKHMKNGRYQRTGYKSNKRGK